MQWGRPHALPLECFHLSAVARKGAKQQRGIVAKDSEKGGPPRLFRGRSSEGPPRAHFISVHINPVGKGR